MGLHDSRLAIHIDHQPRQLVALAMHQAERVILAGSHQPEGLPQAEGTADASFPPGAVSFAIAEREDAHRDAAHLVVPRAQETAFVAEHPHPVALDWLPVHAPYRPGKHPRMETEQAFFFFRF